MYVCRLYYNMSVFPSKSWVKMEGSGWTNEVPALRPSTPLLSPTPACPSAYVHPVGISGFNFRILTNTLTVSKVFRVLNKFQQVQLFCLSWVFVCILVLTFLYSIHRWLWHVVKDCDTCATFRSLLEEFLESPQTPSVCWQLSVLRVFHGNPKRDRERHRQYIDMLVRGVPRPAFLPGHANHNWRSKCFCSSLLMYAATWKLSKSKSDHLWSNHQSRRGARGHGTCKSCKAHGLAGLLR